MGKFTNSNPISLDYIRYEAQKTFGSLPFGIKEFYKEIQLDYDNETTPSDWLSFVNPVFITNIQFSQPLEDSGNDISFCSVLEKEFESYTNINCGDTNLESGEFSKHIRICGKNENGSSVTLRIYGYEVCYKLQVVLNSNDGVGIVSGSGYYDFGEQVTISATSKTGVGIDSSYIFEKWSDGNTERTRTITIGSKDIELTAIFKECDILGVVNMESLNADSVTLTINEKEVSVPVQEDGVFGYDIDKGLFGESNYDFAHFVKNNTALTIICFGSRFRKGLIIGLKQTFYGCTALEYIGMSNLNTINCETFSGTFSGCNALRDLSTKEVIENLNVSNATSFSYMFENSGFETLDLTNWEFSKEKEITIRGFLNGKNTSLLEEITLPKNIKDANFTGTDKDQQTIFARNPLLEKINGSEYLTLKNSNNDISIMFQNDNKLDFVNLRNLEIPQNAKVSNMFQNCESLRAVRLDKFDTENTEATTTAFFSGITAEQGCKCYWFSSNNEGIESAFTNVTYVDLASFDFYGWTTPNKVFNVKINDTDYELTADENGFFGDTYSNLGVDTTDGLSFKDFLSGDTDLTEIYFNNFGFGKTALKSLECAFKNCTNLKVFDCERCNHNGYSYYSNCETTMEMFCNCQSLDEIVICNGFQSSNCEGMFKNCTSLKRVDLSLLCSANLNSFSAYDMMFDNCTSLEYLNISRFFMGGGLAQDLVFRGVPDGATIVCKKQFISDCEEDWEENLNIVYIKDDFEITIHVEDGNGGGTLSANGEDSNGLLFAEPPLSFEFFVNGNSVFLNYSKAYNKAVYNSLVPIDNFSFYGTNVENVVCGELTRDVTTINFDEGCFQDCEYFVGDKTEFPKGFGKNVLNMGYLFYNCQRLKDISFLENFDFSNVYSLQYFFAYCISLPKNLKLSIDAPSLHVMSGFFRYCEIETIDLTESNLIGAINTKDYLFSDNDYLREIKFPKDFAMGATLAEQMFSNCPNLKTITFPKNWCKNILYPSTLFQGASFENVTFEEGSLEEIQNLYRLFYGMTSLKRVKFPDNFAQKLASANYNSEMFSGCTNLESVELGMNFAKNAHYLGGGMFSGCSKLKKLTIPEGFFDSASAIGGLTTTLFGGSGIEELVFECTMTNVPSASGFFTGMSQLKKITIPDGFMPNAQTIGGLFSGDTSLESVYFPKNSFKNAQSGGGMFQSCTSLKRVEFEEGFGENIMGGGGDFASQDCVVIIPKSFAKNATSVYSFAGGKFKLLDCRATFNNVTSMTSTPFGGIIADELILPDNFAPNVTSITSETLFGGCNIKKVTIGKNLCSSLVTANGFLAGGTIEELKIGNDALASATSVNSLFSSLSGIKKLDFGNNFCKNAQSATTIFNNSSIERIELNEGCFSGLVSTNNSPLFNTTNAKEVIIHKGCFASLQSANLMFLNMSGLDYIEFPDEFAPSLQTTKQMFGNCQNLKNIKFGSVWGDTITNANQMFSGCNNLQKLDLRNINFDDCEDISYFASNCQSITEILIPKGFGKSATTISNAFYYCSSLESINLPDNFGKVATTISSMFFGCNKMNELRLPIGFGDELTTISAFASQCLPSSTLKKIIFECNFPNIDGSANNFLASMTSLEEIIMPKNFLQHATQLSNFVYNDVRLQSIKFNEGFGEDCENMDSFFNNCSILNHVELNDCFGKSATSMTYMFGNCDNLKKLTLNEHFGDSMTTINGSVFAPAGYNNYFEELDFKCKFPSATNVASMFYGAENLKKVSFVDGALESATNMASMFNDCESLVELNLGEGFGQSATNMSNMFYNCIELESLQLPIDFGCSATTIGSMFYNCQKLKSIVIPSGFGDSLSSVTSIFNGDGNSYFEEITFNCEFGNASAYSMFSNNTRIKKITFNKSCFTKDEISANSMFNGCLNLVELNVPDDFGENFTNVRAFFYGCAKLEHFDFPQNFGKSIADENANGMFTSCGLKTIILPPHFGETDANGTAYMLYGVDADYVEVNCPMPLTTNLSKFFNGITRIEKIKFADNFGAKVNASFTALSFNGVKEMSFGDNCLPLATSLYFANTLEKLSFGSNFGLAVTSADFSSKTNLKEVKLGLNFMKNATSVNFSGCTSLTELDLSCMPIKLSSSGFNGSFSGCTALRKLVISSFDTKTNSCTSTGTFSSIADGMDIYYNSATTNDEIVSTWSNHNWIEDTPKIKGSINGGATTFTFLLNESDVKVNVDENGNWGMYQNCELHTLYHCFKGKTTLTSFDFSNIETKNVENYDGFVNGCTSLEVIDLSTLNFSGAKNIANLFKNTNATEIIYGENFNTHNCEIMGAIFTGTQFETIDLSMFDFTNNTNLRYMFYNCPNLKHVIWGDNFTSEKVDNVEYMFDSCPSLEILDLTKLNTLKVTTYGHFIPNVSTLKVKYNPNNFNQAIINAFPNVVWLDYNRHSIEGHIEGYAKTTFIQLGGRFIEVEVDKNGNFFYDIKEDDLNYALFDSAFVETGNVDSISIYPNFDDSGVTFCRNTFRGLKKLKNVSLYDNFCNNEGVIMSGMFEDCESLETLHLPNGFAEKATDILYIFKNCTKLSDLQLPKNFGKNAEVAGIFEGCESLETLVLPQGFGDEATSMYRMFDNTYIKHLTFNSTLPNVSSVADGFGLHLCEDLTLPQGFLPNATSVANLFSSMSNIRELNIPKKFAQNAEDASYLFFSCVNLEMVSIDEDSLNDVTDCSSMFENCENLKVADLSGMVATPTYAKNAFFCESLEQLDIRNIDASELTNVSKWRGFIKDVGAISVSYSSTKFQNTEIVEAYNNATWVDVANE